MGITIHTSTLPHDDPDVSLAFWRDALGFEVRNDVGKGKMRWIRVGARPARYVDPPRAAGRRSWRYGRRTPTITKMMAKGTYGWILLATEDLDRTFERVQASGAEVVQEPMAQDDGVRDCAFRDPAGNLVRIQERC